MIYEIIDEAGEITFEYEGPELDAYSLGRININLHYIIDKVAIGLLTNEGLLESHVWRNRYDLSYASQNLFKAYIRNIQKGSLIETIALGVAVAISDPNVRAVLQGFASNVLYAISASGVRGIKSHLSNDLVQVDKSFSSRDFYEIGPNLRDVMSTAIQNSNGYPISISLKSENTSTLENETKTEEVIIEYKYKTEIIEMK